MTKTVEIAEISTFVAVAETGSLTKAAKVLKTTTVATSRRLAQYEKKLGVKLFDRNTRNCQLTAVGALHLPRMRATLKYLAKMNAALQLEAWELERKPKQPCQKEGLQNALAAMEGIHPSTTRRSLSVLDPAYV